MLCSIQFTTRRHSRTHVFQTRRPSQYQVRITTRRVHRMCSRRIDGRVHDKSHLSRRTSTYGYVYACRHVIILYAVSTTQVIHSSARPSSSSTLYLPTCTFEIIIYNIIQYVIFIMRDDERRFVYFFGGIINRVYYIMCYCCIETAHDDDSVKRILLLLVILYVQQV